MSSLAIQQQQQVAPFGQRNQLALQSSVNAGAVSIEQERAVAEAKGQMQLAKMFPRDLNAVYAELMDACKLPAMANVAFYSVPQGGSKVTGPSIRLAEQIAACVGNFEFGHRELSRVEATATSFGRSEIEVYAWDKEKNNRSIRQITVLHVMDTKDGPRKLRDQKDVDNKIANVASKQARGRILALLPKWLVEAAIEECKKTLAGTNEQPLSVRVRAMTQKFSRFGVTTEHLEKYLGHGLDSVLVDELVDLTGVFNAIREGTPASEFFQLSDAPAEEAPKASGVAETARRAPRAKPAPAQAPVPAAPAPASEESNAPQQESNPTQAPADSPEPQEAQATATDSASADDEKDFF